VVRLLLVFKRFSAFYVCALAAGALSAMAAAQSSTNYHTERHDDNVTNCADMDVSFDAWTHVSRAEETLTVPGSATLIAHMEGPNGVSAIRGSGANYTVHVCKFAAADRDSTADQHLSAISVTAQDGEISVKGPERWGERWVVHLIVETPATASLDFSAENGPIGVRGVTGKIRARAHNGPISLSDCAGDIDAGTENGPLSYRGSSGHLSLHTQNGPLNISLEGGRWQDGTLDGSTQNGPVTLAVAPGYSSGVVVESDGYSPFHCGSCENARRTWDDHVRRVEIGSQPIVVHLSTTNGPVTVATSRD
jgi:hypothetical protein